MMLAVIHQWFRPRSEAKTRNSRPTNSSRTRYFHPRIEQLEPRGLCLHSSSGRGAFRG